MAFQELQLEKNQYSIGDIGLGLLLASIVGMGFIATFYQLFPQFSFPILFYLILGIFGLFFAVVTGGLIFKVSAVRTSIIFLVSLALVFIAAFGAFAFQAPQSPTGSIFLSVPAAVSLMFFGFAGVLEEYFWRGTYIGLRRIFQGTGS